MVWNHRIVMILLECIMLSCSYGCMRNQRKSQIPDKNIATKKVADNMENIENKKWKKKGKLCQIYLKKK